VGRAPSSGKRDAAKLFSQRPVKVSRTEGGQWANPAESSGKKSKIKNPHWHRQKGKGGPVVAQMKQKNESVSSKSKIKRGKLEARMQGKAWTHLAQMRLDRRKLSVQIGGHLVLGIITA